jgi:hypothetical protein
MNLLITAIVLPFAAAFAWIACDAGRWEVLRPADWLVLALTLLAMPIVSASISVCWAQRVRVRSWLRPASGRPLATALCGLFIGTSCLALSAVAIAWFDSLLPDALIVAAATLGCTRLAFALLPHTPAGCCTHCGYDILKSLDFARCPECGTQIC